MARNVKTNAQVVITMNGRQANEQMQQLRKESERLSKDLEKAQAAGDKITMKKIKEELRQINSQLNVFETNTVKIERVLRNLDKATPRELQKTLSTLRTQLNGIERGSVAWAKHVEKIRLVEAELRKVNATLATQKSGWTKMNDWFNDCQTFLAGAAAAVTGLAMAGRKAVNSYAEMEQEMANVRKFTGMTAKEVGYLNEMFKNLDTRTSREALNELAQEAGRLGKQTEEDVSGYVRAADKINVSLDDLGKGATLTLSKLTGIFGVEKTLGTEQSLLAVGSVINELSQNCSASAPYLAQFASRMGGVAAQAGITVQEVMGLGAVLDTTNQGVEAASTAISQVITRLFQDPAKYAKVAGLEVQNFTKLLRENTNEAFLQLLESLRKAGGLETLSPMFKDMGENGARAIAALSSLAEHIEEVRIQQEVANEAFREAKSIDQEFAVQNNTVTASMEKAHKSVKELAISLGEQLQPVMKHVYSSSSIMLRTLNILVKFVIEHKGAIAGLTAAIIAYTVALNAARINTKIMAAEQAIFTAGIKAYRGAILLCQGSFYLLTGNIGRATAAMRLFNTVTKLNPIGLLVTAVTAVTGVLIAARQKTDEFSKSLKESGINSLSLADATRKEQKEVDKLIGTLEGAKRGTKEYETAKKSILSQYGIYLQGLTNEIGEITNLTLAYERLTFAARKSAQARSISTAQENLDDTYFKGIDERTEKLRKSLEKMHMPDRDIERIVTHISQQISSGESIDPAITREIQNFQSRNLGIIQNLFGETPMSIIKQLYSGQREYTLQSDKLQKMVKRPYSEIKTSELDEKISILSESLSNSKSKSIPTVIGGSNLLTRNQAESLLRELMFERSQRKDNPAEAPDSGDPGDYTPYASEKNQGKFDRKAAAEAKAASAKARKEFKDGLSKIRAAYESGETSLIEDYENGGIGYMDYLRKRNDLEQDYFSNVLGYYRENLSSIKDLELEEDKDYQTILNKKVEAYQKYNEARISYESERIRRASQLRKDEATTEFKILPNPGPADEEAYINKVLKIERETIKAEQALRTKGTKEWEQLQIRLEQVSAEARLDVEKAYQKKLNEIRNEYNQLSATEKYKVEKSVIDQLIAAKRIEYDEYYALLQQLRDKYKSSLPGSNYQKTNSEQYADSEKERERQYAEIDKAVASELIGEDEGKRRKTAVDQSITKPMIEQIKNCGNEWVSMLATLGETWKNLWDSLASDSGDSLEKIADAASATFSIVTNGLKIGSEFAQATAVIEQRKIERRYEREIELAQGNSYLVAKLEKEKEEKIAASKNKASESQYQMQIIQATADAITGSMNAYNAALKLGPIGLTLAPILAGVALAAGMANVGLIRKQQEAASAQGYSEGGYTPNGDKNKAVGIVHAGEWVASQKLLSSPVAGSVIELLDHAQRTNTIGRLSTMRHNPRLSTEIVYTESRRPTVDSLTPSDSHTSDPSLLGKLAEVVNLLTRRLDEPFITVNSMTGKYGIKAVKDEYERLITNKNKFKR